MSHCAFGPLTKLEIPPSPAKSWLNELVDATLFFLLSLAIASTEVCEAMFNGREMRPRFPLSGLEICIVKPRFTMPIDLVDESYWIKSGFEALESDWANSGNV